MTAYERLDAWIDAHFDEEVRFLQALVQVPTDTPPGHNAPHAERTAELLQRLRLRGREATRCPPHDVQAHGLESITNLIVRRRYGDGGRTIALNAHGDVVPPGEGWTHDPYGGEVADGRSTAAPRPSARATSRPTPSRCARSNRSALPLKGSVELHFTYDEEFGGEARPRLAAAARPDETRPADRRRLQLPGRHRAQRLPAARGHRARQDGARGHPRHRRRCAAGRGRDPERALRAERPVPAGALERRRHHPPVPERRPHRGRHQHQRGPGQGRAQARPPHDPRGGSGRGRGDDPQRHRRRCGNAAGGLGRDPAAAARARDAAAARQPAARRGDPATRRRPSSASRSRPRARRSTPTCASTANPACRR